MKPRATYDPDADAIGIYFKPDDAAYDTSEEIAPGVTLDFARDGRVIGVEILGVKSLLETEVLPHPEQKAAAE